MREEFARQTAPYRTELLAYCYRMLGTVHDAEDLLQETMLRAWRGFPGFRGQASLRTWLYRIATNACLNALERRERRPQPAGLELEEPSAWVEPFPDRLDPAAVVVERDSMRLAMVAALQYLAPRQRAVLLLRDVLGWRTPEVAALLGVSTIAVNSLLQRAREQLARVSPETATEPAEAERRALLERYVAAFERTDVDELVKLLTADATWEMPPRPAPLYGVAAITEAIVRLCPSWGGKALVPVGANGQPAFAVYSPGPDGCLRAHSVQVLTLTRAGISRVVAFHDPWLFAGFELPMRLVGASA